MTKARIFTRSYPYGNIPFVAAILAAGVLTKLSEHRIFPYWVPVVVIVAVFAAGAFIAAKLETRVARRSAHKSVAGQG